jgi:predicted amidophosphoribosyltransferase
MVVCWRCGTKRSDQERVCPLCGDQLSEARNSAGGETPAALLEPPEPEIPSAENWIEQRRQWMEGAPLAEHRWRVVLAAAAIALAVVILWRQLF